MNFLFISAELTNSATGYCAKTVACELANRGHHVHIVSANDKFEETQELGGHLHIYEIPRNCCRRFKNQCLASKNRLTHQFGVFLSYIYKILIQVKGLFTITPLFDDTSALFQKASAVIEGNTIQLIIPVVNPRESLIVANRLFKQFGIPYVPYYLDSIYGNMALRVLPDKIYKKRVLDYERKWVSDAAEIIMMRSVKNLYESIDVKEYGYISLITYLDIPLLTTTLKNNSSKRITIFDGQFAVLFIGTMPNRIRDPKYVFSLARNLAKNDIHFYFAGKTDYMKELKILMSVNKNVHFLGQINHNEIVNYVEEADVLLNIGNSIPGMLPSKIFEYMAYGKPIISTIKYSSDMSVPYLNQYGASLIVDERKPLKSSINDVLRYIYVVSQKGYNVDIAKLQNIESPLYSNTPKCFCDNIEAVVTNHTM